MSSLISKNLQVGSDPTATNNFTIFQPATPDGTLRIGNGNTGITSSLLTLTSAGNLGLGVTPSAWGSDTKAMELGGSTFSAFAAALRFLGLANTRWDGTNFRYLTGGFAQQYRMSAGTGTHEWYVAPSGTAGNAISFTQAMTLTANGDLLVGTTSNTASSKIMVSAVAQRTIGSQRDGTDVQTHFGFYNPNGQVGSITTSGTSTAFNTSSDYRLKNITGSITTSGAYIDSLNPVEGTWKADGSIFVGLLAHEAQEASRTIVATGTKDGEEMQGMDYSSAEIIANLIAEVKSLRQRLAAAGI